MMLWSSTAKRKNEPNGKKSDKAKLQPRESLADQVLLSNPGQ